MHKVIIALGFTGLLVGCGGGSNFDGILKKRKEFKDKTCACKDQACVDAVEKDRDAWFEKAVKEFKGKPSKAQDEAWDKLEDEEQACKDKIHEAEAAKKGAEMLGRMKAIKDEMCACKDKECSDKVQEKLMAETKAAGDVVPTTEQLKVAQVIGEEMAKCMTALIAPPEPAAPPADPAAPPAPPTP